VMRQGEELDCDLASLLLGELVHKRLERPTVFLSWKKLVTVDQLEQRHGLLAQRMNDMAIIHHLIVLATAMRPPSRQRHQRCRSDKDIKAVIVKSHAQPVTDKPGRHGVKDLAQGEAAAA